MRTAAVLTLAIFFPTFAHAAVIFTEIMYDVSGTDTGREWVEITNTGSSAVDVSGYKFFEANTNHALTLISGSGTLQAGASAVIADDATKFKIDWPSYTQTLFDSSFSLSNTGETIALKDNALTVLDSITYDPSVGAGGDGNSLQLSGGSFIANSPTPGTYGGGSSSGSSPSTASTIDSVSSSGTASAYVPPPSSLVVEVSGAHDALTEVPLHLTARATAKSGAADTSAKFSWGFGDGSSAFGSSVEKVYRYPGTYVVRVTARNDVTSAENEFIVVVKPATVRILGVSVDGITIANDLGTRLDLSNWRLLSDMSSFHIPEGTVVLPQASVLFPFSITNLPLGSDVVLVYPNGTVAARFTSTPRVTETAMQLSEPTAGFTQVETAPITKTNTQAHEEGIGAPAVATGLAAVGAAFPPNASTTEALAPGIRLPAFIHSPWALGFLGVIALAGGAFILL